MQIGIIGLPKSGKTTLFNVLTGNRLSTSAFAPTTMEPNIGMAKVADARMDALVEMFQPRKVVPAEVRYLDVAIPKGKGKEIGGELLVHLSKANGFLLVIRAFQDESVPHPENRVDPLKDMENLELELALIDLAIVERRLVKIKEQLKSPKGQGRDRLLIEQEVLQRLGAGLEKDIPVRGQELTPEERKLVENYQFITAKPLMIVLNIGEDQIGEADLLSEKVRQDRPETPAAAISAKLEMDLADLSPEDAEEFRKDMGLKEPAASKIIGMSFRMLDMISFFTVGPDEVRAWEVPAGTPAVKAAGRIHTDLERGFIRAEVISRDDLVRCGGFPEAKKQGLLRLEGKTYTVQDGDVITVLFNV